MCVCMCVCMVVHAVAGLSFMLKYSHLYISETTAQYLCLVKMFNTPAYEPKSKSYC